MITTVPVRHTELPLVVPRVGLRRVFRAVGVGLLLVLSSAIGSGTQGWAAQAPSAEAQPLPPDDQVPVSNADQGAPAPVLKIQTPVQGQTGETEAPVNLQLPGATTGQPEVAVPQLPAQSVPGASSESEEPSATPTLTTVQPGEDNTAAGSSEGADRSAPETTTGASAATPGAQESTGGGGASAESGPTEEWLYDEFAGQTPPPPEPEPASSATATPERNAVPPSTLSAPRIHVPARRPAARPRVPLPSSKQVEEAARRSASPALFTVGFALLAVALGLHLRQRGPSVETLIQSADIETLLAMLQSEQPVLRERSRQALLERLDAPATDDRIGELVRAVHSGDSQIQQSAGRALSRLQTPAGTGALASVVRDYPGRLSEDIRIELLEELATRPEVEAVDALLDMLHDRSATIRELAYGRLYALLDTLRERKAVAALARVMERGDADLSRGAVAALAQTGSEEAVASLARFAGDYALPPEVRLDAVQALQSLGGSKARAALEERGRDFYPEIRNTAAAATGLDPDPELATLDALREEVAAELYTALAAHFEGRRLANEDGEAVRWEDIAQSAASRLENAGGRELLHAVFHQVDRRLRQSHGRSPRMLRRWWQQQGHW